MPTIATSPIRSKLSPNTKKRLRSESRARQKGLAKEWIDAGKNLPDDFDARIREVWTDEEQDKLKGAIGHLRKAHAYMLSKGAVMSSVPPLRDALKAIDVARVKGARTKAYTILLKDAMLFAFKPSGTTRTKYTGHVFASPTFFSKYEPIIEDDVEEDAYNGVYIWKGIKINSETRKKIVKGLADCCEISQRRRSKSKGKTVAKKSVGVGTSPPATTRGRSVTRGNDETVMYASDDVWGSGDQPTKKPQPLTTKRRSPTTAWMR